eukprot:1767138-Amphidinium_carterae.1
MSSRASSRKVGSGRLLFHCPFSGYDVPSRGRCLPPGVYVFSCVITHGQGANVQSVVVLREPVHARYVWSTAAD